MSKIPQLFGSLVFNETVMKERLPKETYEALKKTIEDSKPLDLSMANAIADVMKNWAIEKGATHYTHWFQPMTGFTAEKHDSFITPTADGNVIMEFSGKELIKGEPDASSFPSGGLRATFEARGYTVWDPTSYAFIKDGTLCIPTAFCSYGGEALDKKTPLLRSMEVVSKQALKVLRLLGDETTKTVKTTVGPEQEYFLIRKEDYEKRMDLRYTGRTLFGAMPPKGQEMDDHYFGIIRPQVSEFMKELDEELWKLGVLAKTKHNEGAPAQHELAPIFSTTNIATDHNQLTMELMKKIADKYGLSCLLHEKPFEGINGSGKHNNWSMSTNTGENLLDPTDEPENNTRFLLFLCAVIKAVDENQDLMRISVASAGNDHRLGANEAPPAIISIFLGDELEQILNSIADSVEYDKKDAEKMALRTKVIPVFKKDNTDRNRTSPFAFTGNKFEFRMVGSTFSIACPNMIINTIVAESLSQFAQELEKAEDKIACAKKIIHRVAKEHKRIIFNGNNYSEEWVKEAQKRGLLNLKSTPEALPHYIDEKNIALFEKHKIFTRQELVSRYEILEENYCKTMNIEARTMLELTKRDIIPAISAFTGDMSANVVNKKAVSKNIPTKAEEDIIRKTSELLCEIYERTNKLQSEMSDISSLSGVELAMSYAKRIIPAMDALREVIDEAETIVSSDYWPYPSYGDMLFYL